MGRYQPLVGSPWRPRGPDDLDDEERARIRRAVLGRVRPLRRTPRDRAGDALYAGLSLLALPAPYIARAVVIVVAGLALAGTATVASADALPHGALYGVKLASEQVRLALAGTAEDRASVELSMAEHRLAEAVRLVEDGRGGDAIAVTSEYGTHLANAAAELAAVERISAATRPVVEQLRRRLAEQQHQAADMATRFVADPATSVGAQLFRTIASFAPSARSGTTVSEGIADHAASVAGQLAAVAEHLAEEAEAAIEREREDAEVSEEEDEEEGVEVAKAPPVATAAPTERPAATAARATSRPTERPAAVVARTAPPPRTTAAIGQTGTTAARATATPKPTQKAAQKPKATVDPRKAAELEMKKAAAEKAKQAAEAARKAAEKAKEAAKRTATPKPAPKR